MHQIKPPHRILICGFVLLFLCIAFTGLAWGEDTGGIILPDYHHIDISMAHGGGTKYVKFDGGGLNAIHMTTSVSEPYGQVTTTEDESGVFYLSDTGGRGFFDDMILMVAVKGSVPDDFRIQIKASGYRWSPTPVLNQPPSGDEIEYIEETIDGTFTKEDFIYGPQPWKPYNGVSYPIYAGQDMNDPSNTFRFFFVDLNAGILGQNSNLTGLRDNGMMRVEYTIENPATDIVFNTYGWCNQSNQGQGISWTNDVTSASTSGPSGFMVKGASTGPAGDSGPGASMAMSSGDESVSSDQEPGVPSGYEGKALNTSSMVPLTGTLSVTKSTDAPRLLPAGDTVTYQVQADIPANGTPTAAILYVYTADSMRMSTGQGTDPVLSVQFDGNRIPNGSVYRDTRGNATAPVQNTFGFNVTPYVKRSGDHALIVKNTGTPDSVVTVEGWMLVVASEDPSAPSIAYWIGEGCDLIGPDPDQVMHESMETTAAFGGHVNPFPANDAAMYLVTTGQAEIPLSVSCNGGAWNIIRRPDPVNITRINVTNAISRVGNRGSVLTEITGEGSTVTTRNMILVITHQSPPTAADPSQVSLLNITGNNRADGTEKLAPDTTSPAPTPSATATGNMSPGGSEHAGSGNPSFFEEIIGAFFGLFAIFDEDTGYTTSVPAGGVVPEDLPLAEQTIQPGTTPPEPTPPRTNGPLFSLTVTTDPEGGTVFFDRMDMEKTNPLKITDLKAGIHTLEILLDGFEPVYQTVDLVNDTRIDIILVPVAMEGTAGNGYENFVGTSPTGGLFIDSYPEWAMIRVDGKVANGVTPYVLTNLRTGVHTVQVSKEGITFPVSKRQVTVNNGTIGIVRFHNVPTVLRSISFASDTYRGDSFTVNGRCPVGRIPQKVTVEGTRAFITVRHNSSYYTWQISDYLPTGETMVLLPADKTFAAVMITSDPEGADIFIDGFPTGQQTPALVGDISSGQHLVAISRMGFIPHDQDFTVVDDPARDTDLTIHMTMEPFMHGSLTVTSNPPDAKIFIDGSDTREKTPHTFTFMSVGSYEMKVTAGNKTKNADVDIFPGEERVYRIDFINDTLDTGRQPIRE